MYLCKYGKKLVRASRMRRRRRCGAPGDFANMQLITVEPRAGSCGKSAHRFGGPLFSIAPPIGLALLCKAVLIDLLESRPVECINLRPSQRPSLEDCSFSASNRYFDRARDGLGSKQRPGWLTFTVSLATFVLLLFSVFGTMSSLNEGMVKSIKWKPP
jgi:hypothetical protein